MSIKIKVLTALDTFNLETILMARNNNNQFNDDTN
ncbi:hypothetical protein SC936_06805 [Aggregatibacter actinomycetemcomitans serotype e str. SC936]|nr:hypothetical protein SC936_06805 [Aggregatibacter actinomycetemcomitans serotype e str. SC936]